MGLVELFDTLRELLVREVLSEVVETQKDIGINQFGRPQLDEEPFPTRRGIGDPELCADRPEMVQEKEPREYDTRKDARRHITVLFEFSVEVPRAFAGEGQLRVQGTTEQVLVVKVRQRSVEVRRAVRVRDAMIRACQIESPMACESLEEQSRLPSTRCVAQVSIRISGRFIN